jgi:hypothetical protein
MVCSAGDADAGRVQLDEGIRLWRDLGDLNELASALDTLGWLLFHHAGDDPGALEAFEQSLELGRALGDGLRRDSCARRRLPNARCAWGHGAGRIALPQEAERRYRESLRAALPLGDVIEASFEVQGVAMSLAGLGDPERALVLAGAVEALRQSLGTWISVAFWDVLLERYIGGARERLGTDADALCAEGRAMAFDDAVELALTPPDG